MPERKLTTLLLEQSNDLIWIIDSSFCLKYANQAYQNFMKQVTGEEKKMDEPIFTEGFGDGYIEKWKVYYERGLNGEHFEIEENFFNPYSNQVEYSEISFKPLTDENQIVVNVACQSRDITSFIKSNTEAEKLLDASLDVICSIDEHGIFTKVSAACKELWGYEKQELIGKAYIDFVIDEDVEKTNQVVSDIIDGKAMTTFENRYKRKDGGITFNLWSARWDPKTQIMFCVARDGREKIRKEELLIESENRFKALVQEGSDLIAILDEAGIYTYVSPTSIGILGMDPEELIGKSPFDYIHPEDAEKVLNSLSKIATERRVEVEQFRFKNKNGEWQWIETVLTNMLDNHAVNGIVANSRDITAKKNETQHLKLLESVITNTNDAVLITEAEPFDEPGPRILYVNEAFTKMTGYTAEEVIGKSPRILQGPNSDKAELARLSKAMRNWEPCEITTINYKKNGDEFWTNFTIIPVADERGWYTHWIAIERDVTEKKKLELTKDLTAKISAVFNVEPDLSSALRKLCEEVDVVGQFSFCEIWLTDVQESLLELKAIHKYDDAATIFYEKSKLDTAFERGQGVPGKIWENSQYIIWEHKGENQELLFRSAAAEKAGIKTIVGFPLMYHNRFIGVLQFGTQIITKNIEWIINVLEELGAFIGAEIARKKTEIELKKIFEFAPDIIATCGFDGFFKTANPYTTKLLGYTEKEFTSKPLTDFLHPDDAQKTAAQLDKLTIGTPIYNFKNRYFSKTGEIKTIHWNFSPSVEDRLIFCIGKDITEEVKNERLLKESNQLSRIGSWEIDLINNSIFWSDITHEIHETDENFKPQLSEAINFYREDFRELAIKAVNACIETGTPFDFEAVLVTKKNNEVWVRVMGRAELVSGKCTRIFGSIQDIHEKKIAELRLKSLANNIPGAIFQFQLFPDGTSKFLNLSKGVEKLYGIDAESIMKNNSLIWDQVLAGGDIDKVKASIGESLATLTNWHVIYRNILPNGKIIWLEGWGTPRRLPDGSTIWDSIVLEITDLKETEQLLASASKLARVGSWEIVLKDNEEIKVFWSSMTMNILAIDESFEPTIANGINFYKEPSRSLMEAAVNNAIETGEAFDLELELLTGKGNDIWIRCIGEAHSQNGKVTRIYGSFQDINTRKLAELNQLKLIKEKSKILESIGDAFFTVDNEWTVTYWNNVAEKSFQKNKNEIVGKNLWEVYQDAIDSDFYTNYHYAMETMETQSFETFYETRDQWLEVTAYPSKDGLSVYFKDITQRKKANEEIAKSEEKRRLIMNGALDAIITIDTNETITFWNAQAEVIFGWKAEEVMGKPLSELIIPEPFRKFHIEGLKNYLKTGEGKALNVLLELSAIRRNKEEFPIELTILPIKQGGGEFFCAFIRDITQRKQSEKKLKQANDRFERVTEATNDAIWDWNIKDNTLFWGSGFKTLFGYEVEKMSNSLQPWTDHIHPEDIERVTNSLKQVIESDQTSWTEEYRYKKQDGNYAFVIDRGLVIRSSEGNPLRMVGAMTDISERKQHEEELVVINEQLNIQTKELERSNEELEQFAFIASHDLQEPLRMITSFMDQLKRKYSDRLDEKGLQYIYFATDGAKRMKQIILDLLLYSRANKPIEQNELINLNEIVSEYTQLRRKVIAEKSATITYNGLPTIETYRSPITQIFHGLLDNALKYVDENKPPHIEISALEKEYVWQFAIKDNGIGIDSKFFDKIFIIFQRLQNRKEHDGTGIGLAIAKRSIEFLGGEIWVESEIDKGSTFHFTIFKVK